MRPIQVIEQKKKHLARHANQNGSLGETQAVEIAENWVPRPKGMGLKILLSALEKRGISIKRTSFDAISVPCLEEIDFTDVDAVESVIADMIFIEIKSANQKRVKEDFSGYFFALTESEIAASEALGNRHRVALFNRITGAILMTSVPEIIQRAKSKTWQVSVQL